MALDSSPRPTGPLSPAGLDAFEGPLAAPALSRRDAVAAARTELAACGLAPREPAVVTHGYGKGCLVVALAGTFDRAEVDRLRERLGDLDRTASDELVVEMSGLSSCSSALARFLARLRMQRLIAGARVELQNPPAELTAALGHSPAQRFTVRDTHAPSSDRAQGGEPWPGR